MKKVSPSSSGPSTPELLNVEATRRIAEFLREPADDVPRAGDLPQLSAYEIHEHLGSGGSGSVYMAIPRTQPESVVAVKIFKIGPDSNSPPARILRELDLLSALQLPCVPRIYDYGVDQGRFFITTEVIRGKEIDRYCTDRQLDTKQRVSLLKDVATAVQQLHELGVIHRDLKPSNIMITEDGRPVLIDFGIATMLQETRGDTITAEGMPIGSPGFMAPEQARGDRMATTIRSDVFALGATACYVLTGQTPHDTSGPLHDSIRRIAEQSPRSPRQLDPAMPKPLAAILEKATAHEAGDRFVSAADLAEHLRMWLNDEPFALARPSIVRRIRYQCRRNPLAAASIVLAVAAIVVAAYFGNVALAESQIAEERAQLAEERRQQGEYWESRGHAADEILRQARDITAKFVAAARYNADGGEFAKSLALIYGLDHLLHTSDFGDPTMPIKLSEQRVDTLMGTFHAVYRTDELGGSEYLDEIEQILRELEQARMAARERGP